MLTILIPPPPPAIGGCVTFGGGGGIYNDLFNNQIIPNYYQKINASRVFQFIKNFVE